MTQTMTNRPSVQQFMKAAEEKAANPSGSYKPTFLLLKENQKAVVRPLYNIISPELDACVMAMHSKYNATDPKQSINSVCASEVGQVCELCQLAEAGDKFLRSSWSIMLPVYLYKIFTLAGENEKGEAVWAEVTYKDASGQEVKVKGLRIIELKDFGKIYDVLKFLRSHYRDEEGHNITVCDFGIEQVGQGLKKSFITKGRTPKEMHPNVRALIPTPEQVRQMVIDACRPRIVQTGNAVIDNDNTSGTSIEDESYDDDVHPF